MSLNNLFERKTKWISLKGDYSTKEGKQFNFACEKDEALVSYKFEYDEKLNSRRIKYSCRRVPGILMKDSYGTTKTLVSYHRAYNFFDKFYDEESVCNSGYVITSLTFIQKTQHSFGSVYNSVISVYTTCKRARVHNCFGTPITKQENYVTGFGWLHNRTISVKDKNRLMSGFRFDNDDDDDGIVFSCKIGEPTKDNGKIRKLEVFDNSKNDIMAFLDKKVECPKHYALTGFKLNTGLKDWKFYAGTKNGKAFYRNAKVVDDAKSSFQATCKKIENSSGEVRKDDTSNGTCMWSGNLLCFVGYHMKCNKDELLSSFNYSKDFGATDFQYSCMKVPSNYKMKCKTLYSRIRNVRSGKTNYLQSMLAGAQLTNNEFIQGFEFLRHKDYDQGFYSEKTLSYKIDACELIK